MPRPCPQALATYNVPARRFRTRTELLEVVSKAHEILKCTMLPISLEELANAVGLASFHLQRTFRQVYGRSPARLHRHLRLRHAAARLKSGAPIHEAAREIGYSDASAFTKAFAREFGQLPGTFRKNGQSP